MTTKECLLELYEEEMNRLHEVSADWRMERPRRGCEADHAHHRERAEILQALPEKEEE